MTDDTQSALAEAAEAQQLRDYITAYATNAVKYGKVDRDWANTYLTRLGAKPVTTPAKYQLNVPITGLYGTTVTANSRAEALDKFNKITASIQTAGQVANGLRCGEGVYSVTFTEGAEPVFYSGPQDAPEAGGNPPNLEGLKSGIRSMLKQGVTEQGWGYSYAKHALEEMGLAPLPTLKVMTVNVPVSGFTQVQVAVFEGDGAVEMQKAAAGQMSRTGSVSVKPEEIGTAFEPRPDGASFELVHEDEDEGPSV